MRAQEQVDAADTGGGLPVERDQLRSVDEPPTSACRGERIQPHGALLALHADTFVVQAASENCREILGASAKWLLGSRLADVVSAEVVSQFRRVAIAGDRTANPIEVQVMGRSFDAIVHRAGPHVVVELEPVIPDAHSHSASAIYGAVQRLAQQTTVAALWAAVAVELRALTRFERVLVHHFHADGQGQIVAEDVDDGAESSVGMRYSESVLPASARELHVRKLSRLVVDTAHDGVKLISLPDATPVDLGRAQLRSASPSDAPLVATKAPASILSLSLVSGGILTGMVTCEDSVPHPLPYLLRQGLKVLASQVALQLTAMAEIDRLTEQMHLRTRRLAIISQLAGHSIAEAFFHGGTTVLDLIPAAGAALRVSGTLSTIGETAPEAELLALADGVLSSTGSHTLVSPNLSVEYPELAAVIPSVAGVMMVALGSSGDFLAWIRPEIPNTVLWAGPAHGAVPEVAPKETPPLAAPNETQQGVASRCQGLEEAKELARDLDEVLRRRAEAQLANLALYDQLTGLPNRRLLMENIEQALALVEHRDRLIVLFIDLDGFKRINDTLGHDAGDATLTLVGERILRGAREQDTVARIGGDEFVVLCSNIITTDANILAQSLVDVIAQPTTALGFTVDLTASIGIASAASAVTALELLHHADSAMYRAKAHGRNRTSR